MLQFALEQALHAAAALAVSHGVCCSTIMYFDLTGKWSDYSLHKNRSVTVYDYLDGWKSFCFDLIVLFLPFLTFCFWYRAKEINESQDTIAISILKVSSGYIWGKLWAFGVHYLLHFPSLYRWHRRHHCAPKKIVASAAWRDSFVEYMLMELPSFGITVLLFPTHFCVHLLHFCLHGWDGACGHSGFKAPGLLGYLFDGEYHYYHHAHLTINYAEVEILDKLFGTHHSQRPTFPKAKTW